MRSLSLPPAVLPALALITGVAVEPWLTRPPSVGGLLGLTCLAFALRRKRAAWLGWWALGLIAGVVQARPARQALGSFDLERPIEALVELSAPAQSWGNAWAAPARILRARQGSTVIVGKVPILLVLSSSEPPLAGGSLRVRGQLSRTIGQANLAPGRPPSWRLRVKSLRLVTAEGPPSRLGALQREVRRRAAEAGGQARGAALARALVLGDAGGLPEEWLRGLRRTGLVHLLSLSGVHVALLAGLVLLAASPLGRGGQRALVALVVLAYLALAGPFPALLRASAMGLLGIAALMARRPPLALNALAVAAAGLVAFTPELLGDLGFQLSCSATAGLVTLTRPLARRFARLPRVLADGLGATVGAQLASLPWALPVFSTVSPVSPLLNLVAIPWTALYLPFSFAWLALAMVRPELARSATPGLDLLARPVGWTASLPASPWVVFPLPAEPLEAAALALLVGAILLWPRGKRRTLLLVVPSLLLQGDRSRLAPPFEVLFLDVGQGDSILLRDGENSLLVDGGGVLGADLGRRVLVPTLARLGVRRLTAIALSHPDYDHCGGLLDLAGYLPIDTLWIPEGIDMSGCPERLVHAVPRPARRLAAGDELNLGRFHLQVVSPPARESARSDNDRSLAFAISGGGRTVLLTGDLERPGEREALGRGGFCPCDVLKVAHHGGATSTSAEWLERVRPRLAVVSSGIHNRYGHPAASTLIRLRDRGAIVLRTDRDGLVALRWRERSPIEIDLPASPR